MSALTSIPHLDCYLLMFIDDKDYRNLKLTCRYFYHLLSDDIFWYNKSLSCLNPLLLDRGQTQLNWERWYSFWSKYHYGLELVRTLKLSPEQVYISMVASQQERKILPGLEAFQNIDLTLEKAFSSSGNEILIEYFLERYNRLVSFLLKAKPGNINYPFVKYHLIIEYLLKQGNDDMIRKLIEDMGKVSKHNNDDFDVMESYKICHLYGRYHRRDLAEELFRKLDDDYVDHGRFTYVKGLIEGHHNEEAKLLIGMYADIFLSKESLVSSAIKVNNVEMINFLPELKKKDEESEDRESIGFILRTESSEEPRGLTSPWKLLVHKILSTDEHVEIIKETLCFGRYDVILNLPFDDLMAKIDIHDWMRLGFHVLESPYKDLVLYFLLKVANHSPDIYSNIFIENIKRSNIHVGCYELSILINELIRIPVEELPKTDFYALLMKPYSSS